MQNDIEVVFKLRYSGYTCPTAGFIDTILKNSYQDGDFRKVTQQIIKDLLSSGV